MPDWTYTTVLSPLFRKLGDNRSRVFVNRYLVVMATPYILTLWIHRSIGYWDQFHLAPVYIGLLLLGGGLALSRRYFLQIPETSSP